MVQKFECCLNNLWEKFTIICNVLMEDGGEVDFSIDELESCLLPASAKKSIEVCEIIISLANREQLMATIQKGSEFEGCSALHTIVANDLSNILKKFMDQLDKVDQLIMLNSHLKGDHFLKKMKLTSLPLHLACWNGNKDIFEILLSYGAELDAQDSVGNTVIHVLVELGINKPELAKQMMSVVLTAESS